MAVRAPRAHLTDWLPDFAIRQDDLPDEITSITDYRKLIELAAQRVYKTEKSETRGEIGELLLHIACRQFLGTYPTVSKVYYKTSSNDVVKGFDLVHTTYDQTTDEVQLWLGEAKFYSNGPDAVSAAIASIKKHLEAGFLTSEKMLLGGKISSTTPGYHKLEWLFDRDTSLDQIFQRLIIPILIAYDSPSCASFSEDRPYNDAIINEVSSLQSAIAKAFPSVSVYCFYVPMDSKEKLLKSFDIKLGAYI